jgi:glutamate carboxypeptidase
MQAVLTYLQDHATEMLADVERLVQLESPSHNREAINRVQDLNEAWFDKLGEVQRQRGETGDILHARVPGTSDGRIVLLAHVDTVYPIGSWAQTWRVGNGQAFGPGVYDMKGGIVQAKWALAALNALGSQPRHSIDFLLTPDEEVGSDAARPMIEDLARGALAVLVLEPPFMNGDLKVARKGVGDYIIRISGRAAHQGVEPEKGRNAIVSAAHLIRELINLQDPEKGTTVGPNVIQGGTASNVVADAATLKVDVRVWDLAEAARVDASLRAIKPLEGTSYTVDGGLNRPPMEPSGGTLILLKKAQNLATDLGFSVGAARVGGGSDGNFTSSLAPTLDGFGAMGAHAHQKDLEYIEIQALAPRTALLAGMLLATHKVRGDDEGESTT